MTFEVHTQYGTVYKTIKDNENYNVGQQVEVMYNLDTDGFDLPKNVSPKSSKGPYLIIAFGAIISLIVATPVISLFVTDYEKGFMAVLMFVMVAVFIISGGYISIIKPYKRKQEMVNCHTVQGQIVDYKTERGSEGGHMYTPIYGYYYNGEEHRLESDVSSNTEESRQIGREVTIVINNATGESYCLEDMNTGRGMGIIFLIVGIVMAILIITNVI